MDLFTATVTGVVWGVYLFSLAISIIFTVSPETYRRIDNALCLEIIPSRILTPLEQSINIVDEWCSKYRLVTGPVLCLLSLVDIRLCIMLPQLWAFR